MSQLQSALDALAADDLHLMSDGQVLDRTAMLVQLGNRVAAELTRTVRHADVSQAAEYDGLKSVRSWLIGHPRLSQTEASRIVRSGRVLEQFPVLAAGFAAGVVTAAQVNVVAEKIGAGEVARAEEQGIDLAAFDRVWAQVAAESPHQSLVRQPVGRRAAADPADGEATRRRGHRPR